VEFGETKQLGPEFSFKFVRSAHILGASMVEVTTNAEGATRRMLFTGDIGRVRNVRANPGKVVNAGPTEGERAEILVMESTYGARNHPTDDPRPELGRLIRDTLKRGGSVVVPAFAVERTQKFLFLIKELMEAGEIPRVPVYADSPMAVKAVEIFLKHTEEFSEDTKNLIAKYGSPLTWAGFQFATDVAASKKINDSRYPCIIVSSSGMVTGGRIQHHLIQRLPDPRNLVLFIGFQAPGTRGFTIKSGAPEVKIFGQVVPIRAQVAALEQFSDHADTPELLSWLHTFPEAPKTTYLVHGEPQASAQLRDAMKKELGWNVQIAEYMEKVQA
jgi:metallo-beta-lactamase family protein